MSVVLIGQVESGKTTLFNRMTNSNQITKAGEKQVTMKITQISIRNVLINLFDYPPFGSCKNKIQNVAGLIIALTEGPVNRIIVTYEFQRTDLILASLNYHLKFVQNYMHLLTIAVTHMDINDEDQIQNQMKQVNKIMDQPFLLQLMTLEMIYAKKYSSSNIISILKEMVNSKAEQIYFNPQRILYLFDFEELEKNLESKFNKQIQILEAGFRKQIKNINGNIKFFERGTQFLQQLIDEAQQYLEMFELTNQNFIMGLQMQERFIKYEIKSFFLKTKKQNKFWLIYQDYLKLQEFENFECSIQNKQWETE